MSLFSFTRADLEILISNRAFAFHNESFKVNLLEIFCLAKVSSKGISLELKAPAEEERWSIVNIRQNGIKMSTT